MSNKHRDTFRRNQESAAERGIPWELTFEQWMELWSGRIDQRGPHKGEYVLCRKNDLGAYAVGNCYVASKSHNSSVRGYKDTRTNCAALASLLPQGVDVTQSRLPGRLTVDQIKNELGYWARKPSKRRLKKDRDKIIALMKQALNRG